MVSSSSLSSSCTIGKPWRILHTESSKGLGGQEYRVLDEALGMAKRGHEVILAIPKDSQMTPLAKQKGLSFELTPSGKFSWVNLILAHLRIIHRHRIQIVATHGSLDSWTASVAGRLSPLKPIIIRTRHKSTPISQTWRHQWLYKYLPHGVMTTSEGIRKDIVRGQALDPRRTCSVPTGVNFSIFDQTKLSEDLRNEFGFSKDAVVIGTVAFLRDYKGIHLCVEAIGLLRKSFPTINLLIVGDGPERLRLQAQVQALGLQDHVYFAGFREDVHRVLATLNMFVLPSTAGEGVPQAITQAMAMGVPVVATAIGGIPEVVVHEKTGMLAPVNDVSALIQCIQTMLNNTSLRDKIIHNAQRLIAQSYSVEVMLDAVEQFYEEMFRANSGFLVEPAS